MNRIDTCLKINLKGASGTARFAINTLSACLFLAFGTAVHALPTGGVVAAGAAGIANSASTTTITQTSSNAVINWQSFGVGAGQTVQFIQPGSSSIALNRVLGSDPSSILGNLAANGKVFLLNPNGILFGSGASVNVGGLVASTLSITDANFMAGRYAFTDAGNGTVVNQGTINAADGGYVALMGKSVSNQGIISAKMGTVALAAGTAITMDVGGDGLLNLSISQGAVNALVENGGMIRADGGRVLLTAQAAGNLLHTVVNNTGVIQAQTIGNRNGEIFLLGDMQSGTVSVGGTLDASGTGAGQTGGSITATGHHVGLFGAQINASGDAGGGTVLVGGGYQGSNAAVPNASATYMSADSMINVDALSNGNGGTAVLWSNDSTRAYGTMTARGGALVGDGGLIETSSHWLDVSGIKVSASASNGKSGLWLLDPTDVTISNAGTTNGTFAGGVFSPNGNQATANVDVADIIGNALTGLTGGTNITINTANNAGGSGDITVALGTAITWTRRADRPATTLTLNAVRNLEVNGTITAANNGNVVACCGVNINVRGTIGTTNGSILLSAGNDIKLFTGAAITTTNGNITMCAGNDVIVDGKIVLTDFAKLPSQSLGLADGLVLSAGNALTAPGGLAGKVKIALRPDPAAITDAPITVIYNPVSYVGPQPDFSLPINFARVRSPLTQFMLAFPEVIDKVIPATDSIATLSTTQFKSIGPVLNNNSVPNSVTLVAGVGAVANFVTPPANSPTPPAALVAGPNQLVTFRGFTLAQNAIVPGGTSNFALPIACCAPLVGSTTGNIVAALVPVPVPVPVAVPVAVPVPVPVAVAVPAPANVAVIPVNVVNPAIALVAPAFATFASYLPGLVPTYASDAGNVFFAIKEEEVLPPTVIPAISPPPPFISPPPPYVAPRYIPKPARN